MAERWIINASPLIVLAKVKQTKLLSALTDEAVIPRAVVHEIMAGPDDDPARAWIARQKQLAIVDVPDIPAELSAWDLGAGETAVMAYALAQSGWTAILDDNAARKCARSFSIAVKGTLAVIILAKQNNLIPSAAEVVRQLQSHNYRIQDDVVREALARTVGEQW